jgi:hypothetical protein
MDERTHRRYRLICAAAGGGNAVDIFRNLLAGGNKAGQGVGQQNGEECDREGQYAISQNSARDKTERPPPRGRSRLARHLLQRLAVPHRIPVFGRGSASTFDGFGNLTKGLTFSPERAACVAECRVSEHAGLIHAFDPPRPSPPWPFSGPPCHRSSQNRSGDSRIDGTARSRRPLAQRTVALEAVRRSPVLQEPGPRPSVAAVATLFIGNCAGKLHL